MNNKMLQEIGSKLDVSAQDIKGVQKGYFVSKMKYYIATAIVGILTFIIGFFAGRGTCPETIGSSGGYPFAGGLFALGAPGSGKRASKIAGLMLVVVGFFVALKAVPIFGQAMDYGAYRKRR